jgi:hypothetical protein
MPSQIPKHLPLATALLGALAVALAIAWWLVVFAKVVGNGYLSVTQSAYCAGASSTICDLAMSLCRTDHLLGIRWYSPQLLWVGTAFVFLAMYFQAVRPKEL